MHWYSDSICSKIEEKGSDLGIVKIECLSDTLRVKSTIKLCIEHDTKVWFLSNFV